MLNPWMLLGLVVFWIVSVAAAGYKGMEYQKGQDSEAQLKAVTQAVSDANAQAVKDKALAIAQAQRDTQARTTATVLRSQANAAFQAKPQPIQCDWDQPSYGVLVASVKNANGDAGGTGGLPDAVRKANEPDKQQSGRDPKLDNRRNQPAR